MKKLIISLIIVIIIISGIIGVSKQRKNTQIEYNESTITSLGVDLETLEDDIIDFVLDTYMPVAGEDKGDYISSISKYLTELEYNELLQDIGDYDDSVKTEISDLTIRYALADNNTEGFDEIMCSFYLKKSKDDSVFRNRIVLVFKIQGGKISKHNVYTGYTQIQK